MSVLFNFEFQTCFAPQHTICSIFWDPKVRRNSSFYDFDLQKCFAPAACTFWASWLPKLRRTWQILTILTSTRHSGVLFLCRGFAIEKQNTSRHSNPSGASMSFLTLVTTILLNYLQPSICQKFYFSTSFDKMLSLRWNLYPSLSICRMQVTRRRLLHVSTFDIFSQMVRRHDVGAGFSVAMPLLSLRISNLYVSISSDICQLCMSSDSRTQIIQRTTPKLSW